MPNVPLILVIAGIGILALYVLTGGRRGNQSRGTDLRESGLVIRPGDGG